MFWSKKEKAAEALPVPSDIFAQIVAERIVMNPQKAYEFDRGPLFGKKCKWEQDNIKIVVETQSAASPFTFQGKVTTFKYKNNDILPTPIGIKGILTAIDLAIKRKEELEKADVRFKSDMAACDAIEEIMNTK